MSINKSFMLMHARYQMLTGLHTPMYKMLQSYDTMHIDKPEATTTFKWVMCHIRRLPKSCCKWHSFVVFCDCDDHLQASGMLSSSHSGWQLAGCAVCFSDVQTTERANATTDASATHRAGKLYPNLWHTMSQSSLPLSPKTAVLQRLCRGPEPAGMLSICQYLHMCGTYERRYLL